MHRRWQIVFLLVLLSSCKPQDQSIEIRCEAPKVLEDAFVSCLGHLADTLNENIKCKDDLSYYRGIKNKEDYE